MNGIELVIEIFARKPELPCLILSGHGEARYAEVAMAAGARGYIVKGRLEEIPLAITRVLQGGTYLSESLEKELGSSR